jgi:hypothetical protein
MYQIFVASFCQNHHILAFSVVGFLDFTPSGGPKKVKLKSKRNKVLFFILFSIFGMYWEFVNIGFSYPQQLLIA